MSWDDTEHYRMGGDYVWPTVQETKDYRAAVRILINKIIDRTPIELPVTYDSKLWALFMGFEHERIHYETSSVLIHQLPIDMVQKPEGWIYGPAKIKDNGVSSTNSLVQIADTKVRLGKSFDFPSYGWDNEYGSFECQVSAFEVSKFKVTNEEFFQFVLSGGYTTPEYWTDEGWRWVIFKKCKHPFTWVCPFGCKSGGGGSLGALTHCQSRHFSKAELEQFGKFHKADGHLISKVNIHLDENGNDHTQAIYFKYRAMFDIIAMPSNWPVEVNYHEAKAFCKWKGDDYRVISEAEHHAIRDTETFELDSSIDLIFHESTKINHNMVYGSSTPVNMYPANSKGIHDVFGNVWEWTEDHFNALPGSRTNHLYDDFSTPCYDGRHNIIMGGSWISTGDEASRFARFMFRRHFFQHCGFRIVRSLPTLDGSIPNPQIRLIEDRIQLLNAKTPDNPILFDVSKLGFSQVATMNTQYLYDSHLHPEFLDNELAFEYEITGKWFAMFMAEISSLLIKHNVTLETATHFGCSTGRVTFELTKLFDKVIGLDFSSSLLQVCENLLKSKGKLESSKPNISIDVSHQADTLDRVVFKQMTWVPNEIPASDLALVSFIHRVMCPLSWLPRMREIVKPNGLLIVHQRDVDISSINLLAIIGTEFIKVHESSINANDSLTAWKFGKGCHEH